MKEQLILGNAKLAGEILSESHESLKIRYEVSCEEIDYIVKCSESFVGWYGGRIIGGGFGGCSLHLIADNSRNQIIQHLQNCLKIPCFRPSWFDSFFI